MSASPKSVCEETVYESVFRAHGQTLRNFIYYKCGNAAQADDIMQEAFIKLWHHCAKVPFEKARAFLFRVANNAFLNEVSHQKVKLRYQKLSHDKATPDSPESVYRQKEFQDQLETAIANLSVKQREVFLLHKIEKKKYSEIAEMLGISVKAVEKRMHAALVQLRKTIPYFNKR